MFEVAYSFGRNCGHVFASVPDIRWHLYHHCSLEGLWWAMSNIIILAKVCKIAEFSVYFSILSHPSSNGSTFDPRGLGKPFQKERKRPFTDSTI